MLNEGELMNESDSTFNILNLLCMELERILQAESDQTSLMKK